MHAPLHSPHPEQKQATAFIALVLGAVAMGISPIFVRFANADVGPFASAFWRVFLALPFLYAWMRIDERDLVDQARPRPFSRATIFAGLAFAGDLFFWHLAILNTTVANATFFATTAPVFVILIAALVLRERISLATYIGLGFCLLGGAALIGQSFQVDPARITGDAFGIVTATFFASYFIFVGQATKRNGAARVTFESTVVTAAALFVVALVLDERFLPHSISGIAALLALAIISQSGGQGLLAVALRRLPAVFSSLVIFLEALAAAFLGWIVLGESLSLLQACGGLLVLFGIWVARPQSVRPAA